MACVIKDGRKTHFTAFRQKKVIWFPPSPCHLRKWRPCLFRCWTKGVLEQKDSSTGGQFVTIKTADVTETKNSLRKGGGNVWFWRNLSIWFKITKQFGWKWRNRSANRMSINKIKSCFIFISASHREERSTFKQKPLHFLKPCQTVPSGHAGKAHVSLCVYFQDNNEGSLV